MAKPLVLVIEDDPTLGVIFQTTLKRIGFDVVLDADGNKWQKLIANVAPVFVVTDMHLPYAMGTDIIKKLRAEPKWKDIPVLIVTADIHRAKDLEEVGEQVLLKPVSVARLQEVALRLHPIA